MEKIESQDDLITNFILYNWMKEIAQEITKEDIVKQERKKNDNLANINVETVHHKIGFEFYFETKEDPLPSVSYIIQKINLKRRHRKDINVWIAIIPYNPLNRFFEYGVALGTQQIYSVWYFYDRIKPIEFFLPKSIAFNSSHP
ncbi:MAG: hypothetical protein AABX04_00905 [Nanoarchaeota archaeon]